MSNDQVIVGILKESRIDYDMTVYEPEKSFVDNGFDSLDVMTLFLHIEEKYSVNFSDEEVNDIHSPRDLSIMLQEKLSDN